MSHACMPTYGVQVGYEKRDHIVQNAFFWPFFQLSPFQGLKSPRLLAGLLAVWAFYLIDPMLEAAVSLLSRQSKA